VKRGVSLSGICPLRGPDRDHQSLWAAGRLAGPRIGQVKKGRKIEIQVLSGTARPLPLLFSGAFGRLNTRVTTDLGKRKTRKAYHDDGEKVDTFQGFYGITPRRIVEGKRGSPSLNTSSPTISVGSASSPPT